MSSPERSRLETVLERHPRRVLAGLLALALALALWRRFVLDDAFISFAYARNLVEGRGLTWYGDRVEGYTNFLWVLWIALGLRLGRDPILWAQAGGVAAFLAAICGMWRLGSRLFRTRLPLAIAGILFVTNFTVVSFASSGLETMLQCALLVLAAALLCDLRDNRAASSGRCVAASCVAALALLTRLDSVVPLAVLFVTLWAGLPRPGLAPGRVTLLVAPALVLVGAWVIWKHGYYHRLLPNSFYVKTGGGPSVWLTGVRYLVRFLHAYLLWPFLGLALARRLRRRAAVSAGWIPPLAVVICWALYVALVGGSSR